MKNRIVFRTESALIVIRLGETSNKKIAPKGEKIVQTYSFTKEQFKYVAMNESCSAKDFFSLANGVCFDCPFKGYLKCYTHKFTQYSGFLSMLRSISKDYGYFESIPFLSDQISDNIITISKNRYVRFGSYGEPTLIDISLVSNICDVAKSWTGYTHQWRKRPEFSPYFMGSTHNLAESLRAELMGFRSFIATNDLIDSKGLTNCPASKEMNFISNCSKCGLCSGSKGKGKKSIQILNH